MRRPYPRPEQFTQWADWARAMLLRLQMDQQAEQNETGVAALEAILADGDKGDITLSSLGTVWNIDAGVVGTTELGGDITTAGKALLDDADASAQRTTLGLAAIASSGSATDLSTGTVATARLGSGTANSSSYLRGDQTWATIAGGSGGMDVLDEGSTIAGATFDTLDFVGAGVTVTDAGGGVAEVSIPGGSGGGSAEGRDHVVPTLTDFAWINQGSAAATQRGYGVSVSQPSLGSDSLAILKKAVPSVPYTITARFKASRRFVNYTQCGLIWRASGSGAITSLCLFGNGGSPGFAVNNWNSPTSFNSTASSGFSLDPWTTWFRMRDDNTNRMFDMSPDGDEWVNIFSVARTTFITPDEVGFYIDNNGGSGTAMAMTLLSWEEA